MQPREIGYNDQFQQATINAENFQNYMHQRLEIRTMHLDVFFA